MTNEMIGWGLAVIGGLFLLWAWWPKKKVTETLEEVKATEAPAKVEPQITDAVTQAAPATKKVAAKKAPAKKAAPKKTSSTKVKAAPKKAVKKGKK
jgi:hypothetical protein